MRYLHPLSAGLILAFGGGFTTHYLYSRWNKVTISPPQESAAFPNPISDVQPQSHPVVYQPSSGRFSAELRAIPALDVEKLRELVGNHARVRGRIFRIGHSAKSNTYFLDFGPSREALTAIIFASAVESFERQKLAPKGLEGKEVEIDGVIKDHPQYGLEIILDHPAQIRIMK
jgi:hypothetical protein